MGIPPICTMNAATGATTAENPKSVNKGVEDAETADTAERKRIHDIATEGESSSNDTSRAGNDAKNVSHATDPSQSKVPEGVQKKVPEKLERVLPDSIHPTADKK